MLLNHQSLICRLWLFCLLRIERFWWNPWLFCISALLKDCSDCLPSLLSTDASYCFHPWPSLAARRNRKGSLASVVHYHFCRNLLMLEDWLIHYTVLLQPISFFYNFFAEQLCPVNILNVFLTYFSFFKNFTTYSFAILRNFPEAHFQSCPLICIYCSFV
jgi:hypothetical protein